jgi:hypothetical protein
MSPRILCVAAISCALLVAFPVRADAPASFVRLRDRSEQLDSLTSFLERYVGNCTEHPSVPHRPDPIYRRRRGGAHRW